MASKKVIPFEKSFASCDKAKYWHKEKNGDIRPGDITIRTGTKYWFICNNIECRHDFLTSPDKIARGNWCIYCGNNKICDNELCKICFNKSFASHEKVQFWDIEKNGITPNKVNKYNNNKFWFNCNKCLHDFQSALTGITAGSWCPFCSPLPKQLCNNEHCKMCFENSFASHDKAQYWNYELNISRPRDVFKSNNKKYYFTCPDCKHVFDVSLCNLSVHNRWCPYCGVSKLCDDNKCKICFEKSFAAHNKSTLWSSKNIDITPRQVSICSGKKYWFTCIDCIHDFEMAINHIVRFNRDKTCPICSSQYLCNDKECKICFEKSFASSPFTDKLNKDKNQGLNPRNIFKCGGQTLFFDCECGHIVETKAVYIDNKF
jgi:hypothetical protein